MLPGREDDPVLRRLQHLGLRPTDGVHLDAPAHQRLGAVLARQVRELLA
jgi:lysophospholipase L1-like esterase